MPPRPSQPKTEQRPQPGRRRVVGSFSTAAFLSGVLERTRGQLPAELQGLVARQQGALVKLYEEAEPGIHFELWLHHNRGRAELGLHFETRDAERNQRLLEYVEGELGFLKAALGQGLEAEPWDKGWTRVYLTRPLARLGPEQMEELATAFSELIAVLEPIRREAMEAAQA
jgi:hypothetical protein